MGDGEDGPVDHDLVESLLHHLFGDGVQGARGFVEDQYGRIAQDGPGDDQTLFFAS